MSKTIVSIISEQTVPNYIFIKERYEEGDELLFISSRKMSGHIAHITKVLNLASPSTEILLEDGQENQWNSMYQKIEPHLSKDKEYYVNLTGGTKYMSLLIYELFKGYKAQFFYIPFPFNTIICPNSNESTPLHYRVNINEYLMLCGIQGSPSRLSQSQETAQKMYDLFQKGFFKQWTDELGKLRAYRDKNKDVKEIINKIQKPGDKLLPIPRLQEMLRDLPISYGEAGKLTKYEIRYITGGWFEEYVYYLIKEYLNPTDIQIGVLINEAKDEKKENRNDLDVVFTLGNKLFVIECKTGIDGKKMFNEIIYKATALKEALLKISANAYIFALCQEDEKWTKTAKYMKVTLCDKTYFEDLQKRTSLLEKIKQEAKE